MSQHLLCRSRICLSCIFLPERSWKVDACLGLCAYDQTERLCPMHPQSSPALCLQLVSGCRRSTPIPLVLGACGWGGMIGGQLEPWPACLDLWGNTVPKHHSKEKDGMTHLFQHILHTQGTALYLLAEGRAEAESHRITFLEWYFTPWAWLSAASYLSQKWLFHYIERIRGCSTAILNFGS